VIKAGVIDPAKVTRLALQNAASIAVLMLITETLVADIREEEDAVLAGAGHGGGMGDSHLTQSAQDLLARCGCARGISRQSCRTTLRRELLILSPPLYSMKPSFLNLFMKKFTRERVVPTISASVSCDTLGIAPWGCSCLP
jgi:hypothetical protein